MTNMGQSNVAEFDEEYNITAISMEADDDHVAKISFSWWIAVLLGLFGISSWVAINGLWMELPLLVNVLPEGWNLPAYLSILIQLANVGPLVYVLLTRICRAFGRGHRAGWCMRLIQPPERLANFIILVIGLIASLLLTRLWNVVVLIPGLPANIVMGDPSTAPPLSLYGHSLGLFALTFALGMVDCMSSVTFLAYLANMPAAYAGALLFGETCSGLLPSLFALIQGATADPQCLYVPNTNGTADLVPVYSDPRFPVSTFFGLIAGTTMVSLLAFCLLDCLPSGLGQTVTLTYQKHHSLSAEEDEEGRDKIEPGNTATTGNDGGSNDVTIAEDLSTPPITGSRRLLGLCLLLTAFSSCLSNGLLPSLQSFSTAAYDTATYHLAVTLSGLTAPLVAMVVTAVYGYEQLGLCIRSAVFFWRRGQRELHEEGEASERSDHRHHHTSAMAAIAGPKLGRILAILGLVASLLAAYIIYLATASPNPPRLGGGGPAIAVLAWILVTAVFTVQRTWITLHLVRYGSQRNLRTLGIATQIGSAVGALVSFLLTAQFNVFASKVPCAP